MRVVSPLSSVPKIGSWAEPWRACSRALGIAHAEQWIADPDATFVTLLSLAAVHFELPVQGAALGFLFSWLESQVAAATRLVPIGHIAAQRVLSQVLVTLPAAVSRGLSVPCEAARISCAGVGGGERAARDHLQSAISFLKRYEEGSVMTDHLQTGKRPEKPALRLGVGGPVGSGKTALVDTLCKRLRDRYQIAVVTNDIYTREDADFLLRSGALSADRIVGVETGGCPHTAIREDASINLEGRWRR